MTSKQRGAEAEVKIRASGRPAWIVWTVLGGSGLALAATSLLQGRLWVALPWFAIGCGWVALALRMRTIGVDLTGECAIVRGLRRRRIPWCDVQAVVRHKNSGGTSAVRFILENDKSVTLLYPGGDGAAEFVRVFQRIDQWWLAHRGESWRPVSPKVPRSPV